MHRKRLFLPTLALSLLLLTSLLLSLTACGVSGDVASREEIEARMAEAAGVDKGYAYAASYIDEYGISAFDKTKMRRAELYINAYMLYNLPPAYEIAESCAALFLEYFYDEIDLTDRVEVTDALLKCYMSSLGDRYAVYRNPAERDEYYVDMSGSFVGIGITVQHPDEFTVAVTDVISGSPAERAGIKPGDLIVAVDGIRVADVGYEKAVNAIRGGEGTSVSITVERGGEELTLTAVRETIIEELVSYSIDEMGRGYIKIYSFDGNSSDENGTANQLARALNFMEENGAVGIVFDLRGNPGGYLSSVAASLDCFVPSGTPIVSYAYKGEETTVRVATDDNTVNLPMVILCNGRTASAGELFCAALRDWGKEGLIDVRIVGETTFGKGVMQSEFALPDGSILIFTTSYYNPPSGDNYDGVGVVPDVTVIPEGEGDIQLDAALDELDLLIINSKFDILCHLDKAA